LLTIIEKFEGGPVAGTLSRHHEEKDSIKEIMSHTDSDRVPQSTPPPHGSNCLSLLESREASNDDCLILSEGIGSLSFVL